MKQAKNFYRYTLTTRLGTREVHPVGEPSFTIEWNKEDEKRLSLSKTLPSKMLFIGDDFKLIHKIEQSVYRCEYLTLTVQRKCLDVWTSWAIGRISLNDGKFDLDKCNVELTVDTLRPEQCYDDNKSTEINLLAAVPVKYSVKLSGVPITLEKVVYSNVLPLNTGGLVDFYYWGGDGTPQQGGWGRYRYFYEARNTEDTYAIETSWAREIITLPCGSGSPGAEWVQILNTCPGGQLMYARPARTYGCTMLYNDSSGSAEKCNLIGDASTETVLDNGMLVKDIFTAFIDNACPGYTVRSNFFQINPTEPSTINYVTQEQSKVRFLMMFQKSDVKRPAANNATKALLTFEKFIDILTTMFNLRWDIVANVLIIEHVSYFTREPGLELSALRYVPYIAGKRKYSYQNEVIPQREEFTFMEATPGDFAGVPITYTGTCISIASRNTIKKHVIEKVTTDVSLCLSHPSADDKTVSDDGFVMIACEFDGTNYAAITDAPILGGNMLNNSLSWAHLHNDYFRHDRPLIRGTMNNIETEFISSKPTKKGEKISIPLCCGDVFNPDDSINAPLGIGIVEKAVYHFNTEMLDLEILYPANYLLNTDYAPVAVNDTYTTPSGVTLIMNVLANDTDAEASPLRVEIESFPIHGSLINNADNTLTYYPDLGYVGDDHFTYRAFDEWNTASNLALVNIIIT